MTSPRAFTLLELLVAIVLTSVVALLVYGSADAGLSTQTRLDERLRALQTERAMRVVLHDALRNARPALRAGDRPFVLEDRRDARGRPADRLSFIATGGFPPLTDESQWLVQIEPADSGIAVFALPIGVRAAGRRLLGRIPGASGVDVRVLSREDAVWRDGWSYLSIVPAAVALTFTSDSGVVGIPLRVALPLGGAP